MLHKKCHRILDDLVHKFARLDYQECVSLKEAYYLAKMSVLAHQVYHIAIELDCGREKDFHDHEMYEGPHHDHHDEHDEDHDKHHAYMAHHKKMHEHHMQQHLREHHPEHEKAHETHGANEAQRMRTPAVPTARA